jgi:hypothetical protein
MAEENKKNEKEEKISEDLRYKYIGFDIFPKKGKDFWKDEEEKRKHLEKLKKEKSQATLLDRDHSLVRFSVFSKTDKIVVSIASFLLFASLFIPWFSLRGENLHSTYTGLGFIFKLGMLFGYAPLGGFLLSLFLVLLLLTILFSFGVGVLNLVSIYKKHNDVESYLAKLKRVLKLNLIPLSLWIVLIIIGIIGIPTPFAGALLGVEGLGDGFNVINLFAVSSFGVWFCLPCLIINCVKINDL